MQCDSSDSSEDERDGMECLTDLVPEGERLQRLNEIQTPFQNEGEEPFGSLVKLVRDVFEVPMVKVSLVYEEFQWLKAQVGKIIAQTPRTESFCAWTLLPLHPEILHVPDATRDERFSTFPSVTDPPNVRFYCGVPLVTQDHVRLGALCLEDRHPRSMTVEAMRALRNLAELTSRELLKSEMGKNLHQHLSSGPAALSKSPVGAHRLPSLAKMLARRQRWFEQGLVEGVLVIDLSTHKYPVLWANPGWTDLSGNILPWRAALWSLIQPAEGLQDKLVDRLISQDGSLCFRARLVHQKSKLISCTMCFVERSMCAAARLVRMPEIPPSVLELEMTTPLTLHNGRFAVLLAELADEVAGVVSEGKEATTSALAHGEAAVDPSA